MGREFTTLIAEGTRRLSAFASGLSLRVALLAILASFAALVWLISTAPPLVGLVVTVAIAIGWCLWLERNPDASGVPPRHYAVATASRVHVLATTPEGTKKALTVAKQLTVGCDSEVVLLLPRLISLPTPFNPATEERRKAVDEQRALAADVGMHVAILFCVCHRPDDIVRQLTTPSSVVIVGGRRRPWWPSREERLANRLTHEGYRLLFADVHARDSRGLGPAAS